MKHVGGTSGVGGGIKSMSMALGNFLNYDTPYDKSRLSMSHSEVCTSAEQKTSNDIFGLAKKGFASITLPTISFFLAPRRRAIALGNYYLVRTELANLFSYKLLVNFFFTGSRSGSRRRSSTEPGVYTFPRLEGLHSEAAG